MNLTNFFLAGHSYGGYIVGNYALKYSHHIKKLLLISPVGIRVPIYGESWMDRLKKDRKNKEDFQNGQNIL